MIFLQYSTLFPIFTPMEKINIILYLLDRKTDQQILKKADVTFLLDSVITLNFNVYIFEVFI